MARATGPLMSFDASGTIAKSITFSKWKGRNYVRRRVIPHNPNVASQIATRAMMRFLSEAWKPLGSTPKTSWNAAAEAQKISPFNRFVQVNMREWTQFNPPSQAYPAARLHTPAIPSAMSAAAGVHEITGSVQLPTDANFWGLIIFLDTVTIVPARNNSALVLPGVSNAYVYFTLSRIMPGTYKVNAAAFDDDGVLGPTLAADCSVVVT